MGVGGAPVVEICCGFCRWWWWCIYYSSLDSIQDLLSSFKNSCCIHQAIIAGVGGKNVERIRWDDVEGVFRRCSVLFVREFQC